MISGRTRQTAGDDLGPTSWLKALVRPPQPCSRRWRTGSGPPSPSPPRGRTWAPVCESCGRPRSNCSAPGWASWGWALMRLARRPPRPWSGVPSRGSPGRGVSSPLAVLFRPRLPLQRSGCALLSPRGVRTSRLGVWRPSRPAGRGELPWPRMGWEPRARMTAALRRRVHDEMHGELKHTFSSEQELARDLSATSGHPTSRKRDQWALLLTQLPV
jgi:hypothetical protein